MKRFVIPPHPIKYEIIIKKAIYLYNKYYYHITMLDKAISNELENSIIRYYEIKSQENYDKFIDIIAVLPKYLSNSLMKQIHS